MRIMVLAVLSREGQFFIRPAPKSDRVTLILQNLIVQFNPT